MLGKETIIATIRELIAKAYAEAQQKEAEEKKSGKLLFNSAVGRLLHPPTCSIDAHEHTLLQAKLLDVVYLKENNKLERYFVPLGNTTYLTSRRMWRAYPQAVKLFAENGLDESELYGIFHYLPGSLALVERDGHVLVGVRSSALGGTHTGKASLPGGLSNFQETLEGTARRELLEEAGIDVIEPFGAAIAATGRNPDAPATTFVFRFTTQQKEVKRTFEVRGKTFTWIHKTDCLIPALSGNNQPLATALIRAGINVDPTTLEFAPDAAEGCRKLIL